MTEISAVPAYNPSYHFVYVDQESFEQHKPSTFAGLANAFRDYQDEDL